MKYEWDSVDRVVCNQLVHHLKIQINKLIKNTCIVTDKYMQTYLSAQIANIPNYQ